MKKISKTDYMAYLKHPALGWMRVNAPEMIPPVSPGLQAIFDTGHEFEHYAENLPQFIGGVSLGFNTPEEYENLPKKTLETIKNGSKTIFQGRFEYKDLSFICDILQVINERTVDLYEIKSSTKAKPEHIDDLAFQTVVLEGLNFVVRNIGVIHVNNSYEKHGPVLPEDITKTTMVTEEVKAKIPQTKNNIAHFLMVARSATPPDTNPIYASNSGFSEYLDVYKFNYSVPENSVLNLTSLNAKQLKQLQDSGLEYIDDIPDYIRLSNKQKNQVITTKNKEPLVNKKALEQFLQQLEYPLYFLDYETLGSLAPYFDGLKPYQQLPFQYSLHVLENPGAELVHKEYLHKTDESPTAELTKNLLADIGENGTILVWNSSFEKNCNNLLGKIAREHKDKLKAVNNRIVDLMIPFSNQWFVDYRFKGSASIKNVLPVMAPELSYKNLDIQEGGTAQRLWMEAVLEKKHEANKQKILDDLVLYCGLDTLAMVEIYKKLLQIIQD